MARPLVVEEEEGLIDGTCTHHTPLRRDSRKRATHDSPPTASRREPPRAAGRLCRTPHQAQRAAMKAAELELEAEAKKGGGGAAAAAAADDDDGAGGGHHPPTRSASRVLFLFSLPTPVSGGWRHTVLGRESAQPAGVKMCVSCRGSHVAALQLLDAILPARALREVVCVTLSVVPFTCVPGTHTQRRPPLPNSRQPQQRVGDDGAALEEGWIALPSSTAQRRHS